MSKNRFVFIVGIVILILPFAGFPSGFENFLYVLFGFCLIGLSFSVSLKNREKKGDLAVKSRQKKEKTIVSDIEPSKAHEVSSSETTDLNYNDENNTHS